MTHYYSYDCWKCDKRHGGSWDSESSDPIRALAEIRYQWEADEPDAWEYDFMLHTKEELDVMLGIGQKGGS